MKLMRYALTQLKEHPLIIVNHWLSSFRTWLSSPFNFRIEVAGGKKATFIYKHKTGEHFEMILCTYSPLGNITKETERLARLVLRLCKLSQAEKRVKHHARKQEVSPRPQHPRARPLAFPLSPPVAVLRDTRRQQLRAFIHHIRKVRDGTGLYRGFS